MSLDGALLTAGSGLRHVSRQMAQASQNIANAATPGYSAKQVPGEAMAEGGVRSLGPRRDVDEALRTEVRIARSEAAAAALRYSTLSPLAWLQGDPQSGESIGGLVGALQDAFVALRGSPAEAGAQGTALRAAQDLAGRLNDISAAVGRARQSVQDGLRSDVDQANTLLQEVARLDSQARATAASGRSNADLLDQRDAAVSQLAGFLDVTPASATNGGITLILRGGSVLPLDPDASPLSVQAAQVSPESYWGPPGGTLPGVMLNGVDISASLKGGRIGEALALRDRTLPLMQAELDLTATGLAQRLDNQGLRLFTDGGSTGTPPDPAGGYQGAVIGLAGRIAVNQEVAADPRLLRDGTHAVPGFTPNPAGGPSGFAVLLDAVLGRSFGADPGNSAIPTGGLGPGRNLSSAFAPQARIADYATAATASQSMAAAVASDHVMESKATQTRIAALLQQREGVDVDQEMASLVQLQNAYAANARVMATVQDMWDALLSAVR